MKKILILFLGTVAVMMSLTSMAQETEELERPQQDPKAQEKINNLRIAFLTERLGLTSDQAEKFWPVYREFAMERSKIRNEMRDLRQQIDPKNPDPKKQQELIDLGLKVKQRELDLEKDYSGRLLKVITAQQVLNLRQAEQDFRVMLINQINQRRLNQQRKENFRDRNQRLPQRNN
jgi:hypothetical protein